MVTIGVLEFDKVGHMSFDTFHRGAAAPINPFGCKRRLPFGKLFRPPDVETDVAQRRFRSRTCCYSVLILIRPYISDLPVRRSCDRKSQHVTRKLLETFAVSDIDPDLHNIVDSSHNGPSGRSPHPR